MQYYLDFYEEFTSNKRVNSRVKFKKSKQLFTMPLNVCVQKFEYVNLRNLYKFMVLINN